MIGGLDEAKPKSRNEVTAIAFMEASLTKGRLGVKVLRRFMTIKKSRNLLRPRLLFLFGRGYKNKTNEISVWDILEGVDSF